MRGNVSSLVARPLATLRDRPNPLHVARCTLLSYVPQSLDLRCHRKWLLTRQRSRDRSVSRNLLSRSVDRARSAKIIVSIREHKNSRYAGLCKSTDLEAMKRFVCERLKSSLFANAVALEYQARSRDRKAVVDEIMLD